MPTRWRTVYRTRTQLPQDGTPLDPAKVEALGIVDAFQGGQSHTLVRGTAVTPYGGVTSLDTAVGPPGPALYVPPTTSADGGLYMGEVGDLFTTPEFSVVLYRRCTDTVLRGHFAFGRNGATNPSRVAAHLPWTDGNCYWDAGGYDATYDLGPIAGYVKDTDPETIVLTQGVAGKAMYRRGVLLGSNTGYSGTPPNPTAYTPTAFLVGGASSPSVTTVGTDAVETYLLLVCSRQWTQQDAIDFEANPAHIFMPEAVRVPYLQAVAQAVSSRARLLARRWLRHS